MTDLPSGWPCAILPGVPPSVADRQSTATADDYLPQVLALTPRGPAWGTDEAGDGKGASPVMRWFWRAIATWTADLNARDFDLAKQALPSAVTWSLPDWERELGLPDLCGTVPLGTEARINAVRARFGAQGGQSPAFFVCLADSMGYDVTVEEPTQFFVDTSALIGDPPVESWFYPDDGRLDAGNVTEAGFVCDDGECDGTPLESFAFPPANGGTPLEAIAFFQPTTEGGDEVAGGQIESWFVPDDGECDGTELYASVDDPAGNVWRYWVVHVASLGETWFRVDEGELSWDPLEGFLPASDLECALRRAAPPHTEHVFAYTLPTTP